jgi:hypothetical protein
MGRTRGAHPQRRDYAARHRNPGPGLGHAALYSVALVYSVLFDVPPRQIPVWSKWLYWSSPFAYALKAIQIGKAGNLRPCIVASSEMHPHHRTLQTHSRPLAQL